MGWLCDLWFFSVPLSFTAAIATQARADWSAIRLGDPGALYSEAFAASGNLQGGYQQYSGSLLPGFWNTSAGSWVSLAPFSGANGYLYGMTTGTQVGDVNGFAALWHGSAASWINLNPSGASGSDAFATGEDQQAGVVYTNGSHHAALWHGSAASFVDLNPAGATNGSIAYATDGTHQGGYAWFGTGPSATQHAALWSGTAASFIDLNPFPSIVISIVYGMAGDQQVGTTQLFGGQEHAALWRGSAATWVDLNPPGAILSEAHGTTGQFQCGAVSLGGIHAGIWSGTAESFVDLHQFLPAGYASSVAEAISQVGNTLYVAGSARFNGGRAEAWLWVGNVPSPPAACGLIGGFMFAARRRRTPRAQSSTCSPAPAVPSGM